MSRTGGERAVVGRCDLTAERVVDREPDNLLLGNLREVGLRVERVRMGRQEDDLPPQLPLSQLDRAGHFTRWRRDLSKVLGESAFKSHIHV